MGFSFSEEYGGLAFRYYLIVGYMLQEAVVLASSARIAPFNSPNEASVATFRPSTRIRAMIPIRPIFLSFIKDILFLGSFSKKIPSKKLTRCDSFLAPVKIVIIDTVNKAETAGENPKLEKSQRIKAADRPIRNPTIGNAL